MAPPTDPPAAWKLVVRLPASARPCAPRVSPALRAAVPEAADRFSLARARLAPFLSISLRTEASARQSNYEGVNLDEELVKMTTYQQAFNASARLVQAAKDMYDTLLGMVR